MGKWKGIITDIRKGNTQMQLYNLETDIREEHDVAAHIPGRLNCLLSLSITPISSRWLCAKSNKKEKLAICIITAATRGRINNNR